MSRLVAMMAATPPAKPSRPSNRLIAFVTPTIQTTATKPPQIPSSTSPQTWYGLALQAPAPRVSNRAQGHCDPVAQRKNQTRCSRSHTRSCHSSEEKLIHIFVGAVYEGVNDKRKTTPAASALLASQHFLDDAATPPCGYARRGIGPIPRASFAHQRFTRKVVGFQRRRDADLRHRAQRLAPLFDGVCPGEPLLV